MATALILLLVCQVFPGPPQEAITNVLVIDWCRSHPDFLPGMTDIIGVGAIVYGQHGPYECMDGTFTGWPIRFRIDYFCGSPDHARTKFVAFVFVEVVDGWRIEYAPRARFDDISQDRKSRGA